jgi:hypothetical protein
VYSFKFLKSPPPASTPAASLRLAASRDAEGIYVII